MTMKTFSLKAGDIEKAWHVLDAEDVPLGRVASRAAVLLRGKHKPTFSPHLDMGDFVVVVNAEKVRLSSSEDDKKYYRHSGYPGGLKTRTFSDMRAKHPTRIIEIAVKGMLPHNRLGAAQLRHLKVYAGPEHPHEAQLRAGTGSRAQRRERGEAAPTGVAASRPAPAARRATAVPATPEEAIAPEGAITGSEAQEASVTPVSVPATVSEAAAVAPEAPAVETTPDEAIAPEGAITGSEAQEAAARAETEGASAETTAEKPAARRTRRSSTSAEPTEGEEETES